MQHEDPVLSPIIQKIDQNDVSPQVSNYFINGEGLLCHLSKRPSRSPRSNTTRKQVCIPHCLKARILESVHSEYGGHLKFFKTYHRLSENFFWQNMYKDTKNFVRSCTVCLSRKNAFKIPPAPHQPVEQSQEPGETCHIDIFGPLKPRLKTPNIKSNLSPKLRPKFEGPYRVIERFSNVNYRVQHVEQLRKRFNTHVNRMIPFIKRFSYLHLNNLDDLQPDETEVKGIVPSPRQCFFFFFLRLSDGRTRWGPRVSESPVEEWEILFSYFIYSTDAGSPTRVFVFSLFQDIKPWLFQVHWVYFASRDEPLRESNLRMYPCTMSRTPTRFKQHRVTTTRPLNCYAVSTRLGRSRHRFSCFSPFMTWTAVRDQESVSAVTLLKGRRVCWNC
ncbi:integrase_H2C2 domain-containing protein [Trichonephila clavipes]|nr:integrase_H2C2 domain-containing protein [Trichonephila clavipes]